MTLRAQTATALLGFVLIISLVVFLSTTPGDAEAQTSARDLCDACAAVDRTQDEKLEHRSPEEFALDHLKTARCLGFLQGFLDAWVVRVELPIARLGLTDAERMRMTGDISEILQSPFCMSAGGISTDRAVDTYVGYCKLKPPVSEQTARMFLVEALSEAFPACPAGGER